MTSLDTDIFIIEDLKSNVDSFQAKLTINKASSIFNGHFPGQPVVPGACTLQIVKDVLERTLNMRLLLKKADHLKFISMIVPENSGEITLDISYKDIEDQQIKVIAKIVTEAGVCFKFQGYFKAI